MLSGDESYIVLHSFDVKDFISSNLKYLIVCFYEQELRGNALNATVVAQPCLGLIHCDNETFHGDWLKQVVEDGERVAFKGVLFVSCGKDYKRRMIEGAQEICSLEMGHVNVEKHDVAVSLSQSFERFKGASKFSLVRPMWKVLKVRCKKAPGLRLIVDNDISYAHLGHGFILLIWSSTTKVPLSRAAKKVWSCGKKCWRRFFTLAKPTDPRWRSACPLLSTEFRIVMESAYSMSLMSIVTKAFRMELLTPCLKAFSTSGRRIQGGMQYPSSSPLIVNLMSALSSHRLCSRLT